MIITSSISLFSVFFRPLHRLFSVGDIVKESLSSPQSGVVIGLSTTCSLLHSLTASKLDNVPGTKVANARRFHPGDHVIHNNWFGNIEEIMLETRWVTEEGRTFRTYDFESDYQTGTTAEVRERSDSMGASLRRKLTH